MADKNVNSKWQTFSLVLWFGWKRCHNYKKGNEWDLQLFMFTISQQHLQLLWIWRISEIMMSFKRWSIDYLESEIGLGSKIWLWLYQSIEPYFICLLSIFGYSNSVHQSQKYSYKVSCSWTKLSSVTLSKIVNKVSTVYQWIKRELQSPNWNKNTVVDVHSFCTSLAIYPWVCHNFTLCTTAVSNLWHRTRLHTHMFRHYLVVYWFLGKSTT